MTQNRSTQNTLGYWWEPSKPLTVQPIQSVKLETRETPKPSIVYQPMQLEELEKLRIKAPRHFLEVKFNLVSICQTSKAVTQCNGNLSGIINY
ncbi:hypothetical protein TNIN_388951 [Trichonephila inaurata madagascariensis]|uniref:Uncharacterized protein n=1 Tax=Trichonephila inaurata madagascariensis TaxID=2747483 RepID=A0A8X6Y1Q1_9ARAC|nr:hypothetical protein TNIN_388951 [Trichonephila inaurata madagascariensis]